MLKVLASIVRFVVRQNKIATLEHKRLESKKIVW